MKTAADILAQKNNRMISVRADQHISEALTLMYAHKIGAMLVRDESGNIVGIWTERDLLHDVLEEGFDPRKALIGQYMTSDLHTAPIDATIQDMKEMMIQLFIRHLLIEQDGKIVGILSVGDMIRASLIEQDRRIEELRAHTSWQYYETWAWGPYA
jgi:CBS domain-containing protein